MIIVVSITDTFDNRVEDSERMPSSYLPVIGELEIIDLNFEDVQDYTQKIRVRIQCLRNPEDSKPAYKLLKVGLRLRKDLAYDCLHLDGYEKFQSVLSVYLRNAWSFMRYITVACLTSV